MNPEAFLALEGSLTNKLLGVWQQHARRIQRKLLKAYRQDDYKGLEEAIQSIDLEKALTGNVRYVKTIGRSAILFGISRLTPPRQSTAGRQAHTDIIDRSMNLMRLVLSDSSRTLRRRIRRVMNESREAEMAELIKAELMKPFTDAANLTLMDGGGNVALASSLHSSRLASYGYTVEAAIVKQETYMLNAVLDVRTCPVCTALDQRILEVRVMREQLTKVFESTTVQEIKMHHPWPKQNRAELARIEQATSEEIQNMGYGTPPFHPLCRCFVDYTTATTETIQQLDDRRGAAVPPELVTKPQRRLWFDEDFKSMSHDEFMDSRFVALLDSTDDFSVSGAEDKFLKNMLRESGGDVKPHIVTAKVLDDHVAETGQALAYRGTTERALSQQFIDGDLFVGRGVYGNGVYFSFEEGKKAIKTASAYAGPGDEKRIIRMALAKDAKVVEFNDLRKTTSTMMSDFDDKAEAIVDDLMERAFEDKSLRGTYKDTRKRLYKLRDKLQYVLGEDGRAAQLLGYDAIDVGSAQYRVILNRGAVVVDADLYNKKDLLDMVD